MKATASAIFREDGGIALRLKRGRRERGWQITLLNELCGMGCGSFAPYSLSSTAEHVSPLLGEYDTFCARHFRVPPSQHRKLPLWGHFACLPRLGKGALAYLRCTGSGKHLGTNCHREKK